MPNGNIPTTEGVANVKERFPSDHERLMSRINLGDALINRKIHILDGLKDNPREKS